MKKSGHSCCSRPSSDSSSSGIWLGEDLAGVVGVHLVPGGGVMLAGVPGGEIISIDCVGDFSGGELFAGGVCTVGGGGVLAGLGWRGHSPAGGAVLACPLSASFFLPGVFFCKRFCCLR